MALADRQGFFTFKCGPVLDELMAAVATPGTWQLSSFGGCQVLAAVKFSRVAAGTAGTQNSVLKFDIDAWMDASPAAPKKRTRISGSSVLGKTLLTQRSSPSECLS
jgi:hypothetical protein